MTSRQTILEVVPAEMIASFAEVSLHLAAALLTFWGWGELLTSLRLVPVRSARFSGLIRLTSGFAALVLVLLALVYFNIPLKYSAWIGVAGAIGGWIGRFGSVAESRPRRFLREERLAAALLVAVTLVHSVPLFALGTERFFGRGKFDHMWYVVTSQFMVEQPLWRANLPDNAPWMALPFGSRYERLGQNIPIAYLAAVLGRDSHEVYRSMASLAVGFGAVGVFWLLRSLNLPLFLSAFGALWLGVTYGVTYSSIESFFPNVLILFIAPSLAAVLWRYRRCPSALRFFPALLLACLLCCFPELFGPIGIVLGAMWLAISWQARCIPWKWTIATGAATLLFAAPYLPLLFPYMANQAHFSSNAVPARHVLQSGSDGTWDAWHNFFFSNFDYRGSTAVDTALTWLSLLFIVVAIGGLCLSYRSDKSRYLLAILVAAAAGPILLLLLPAFRAYIYFKLVATFLPLFIAVILYGAIQLTRRGLIAPLLARGFVALFGVAFLFGAISAWFSLRTEMDSARNGPYSQAETLATYDYVRAHPEKTYYITDSNRNRATWIAYFARHSSVYMEYRFRYSLFFTPDPSHRTPVPPSPIVLDGIHAPKK